MSDYQEVLGLPPHLLGARHVFILDRSDKVSTWYLAEIVKYIKFMPEVNSELVVRIVDDGRTVTAQSATAVAVQNLNTLRSPPTDLIKLEDSHAPGILYALSARYRADQIYTSIGPILVSFNPFKTIRGLYDVEVAETYKRGKRNMSDQPHVFALAAECLLGLAGSNGQVPLNQSLIICGESGSGKTEATKQCLFYLASAISNVGGDAVEGSGSGSSAGGGGGKKSASGPSRRRSAADEASHFSSGGIESKILLANPLLEAWGNAKTLRNNNSSRFGKYIEVFFDKGQKKITGSANTTYLLEKSRVVFQERGERNYHIFYQLLCGERSELLQELGLGATAISPARNVYLGMGECVSIVDIDDGADFDVTKAAYASLGFTAEDVQALTEVLACILHIANISFALLDPDNADGGVRCIPGETIDVGGAERYTSLSFCAKLLGIDSDRLRKGLVSRKVKSGGNRRNSVVDTPFKVVEATQNKNAFAKELYCRCFDYIVDKVNRAVNATLGSDQASRGPGSLIGVLDIFGFEIFEKNSLEQLCINLANESLQAHFNHHIFQEEINLYTYERIEVPPLDYVSNTDVLHLILGAPSEARTAPGLLRLLDDAGQVRGSGDVSQVILQKFSDAYGKHPRFKHLVTKRCFSVKHYAGDVSYDPTLFLSKNNDRLSLDVIELLTKSSNHIMRDRFSETELLEDTSGRTNKQSVTFRFRIQLDGLIANLSSNQPKYIRCIKPNEFKKPNILTTTLVNEQLTYTGVFEAVKIMQSGYPFRLKHTAFREQYHCLALSAAARKRFFSTPQGSAGRPGRKVVAEDASREHIETMVAIIGSGNCLWEIKVGQTMAFYRSQQYMLLETGRTAVRLQATLLLQRWGRGASVRFLFSKILRGLRDCFRYAVAKDLPSITKLVTEPSYSGLHHDYSLKDLMANFKKIMHSPTRLMEAPLRVCETLHEELSKLKSMGSSLKDTITAITRRDKTIHDEFTTMERVLADMKAVQYDTSLRYHTRREEISVTWTDDPEMAAVDERVRRYGIITRLKRRMDDAIVNINEEECEAVLLDLRSLRATRDVDDVMYSAEENTADSIVKVAAGALSRTIIKIDSALQQGCMVTSRPAAQEASAALGLLEYQVDSKPLRDCIAVCESEAMREDRGRSVRTRKMIEAVRKLHNLRVAVERRAWAEVRDDVKAQGWLELFGIDVKSKEDNEKEQAREQERERAREEARANAAKRPSTKVARKSIVTRKKTITQSVTVQTAQLCNRDRDPFFIDMTTGKASWTLDPNLHPSVAWLTHTNDKAGGSLYYEDLVTGATTHESPLKLMSPAACAAATTLTSQDRAACETSLGPWGAAGAESLAELDEYLVNLADSGAARVPVVAEVLAVVEVQEEVVVMVDVAAEGADDVAAFAADLSRLFVPAQLLGGMREEIKQMSIAALHFSVFPHLEAALARDTVSERIFFNGTQLEVSIDTEDLRRTLEGIEGYRAAFDRTQQDYVRRAKCHLGLRQAASAGDLALLRAALRESQEIAAANQDFANASKICDFYDMLDTLLTALRSDGAAGQPSQLDFSRISLERMNAALDVAKFMTGVQGPLWVVLLSICETMQAVRVCLSVKDFDAALAVMTKAAKTEGGWYYNYMQGVGIGFDVSTTTGSISGLGGSIYTPASPGYARRRIAKEGEKGCELALTLAIQEIDVTKAEIRHIGGMRALVEALDKGPVSGAVGHVLLDSINPTALDQAAAQAKPLLIQTAAVAAFLTDLACLSSLRKLFLVQAHAEIVKVMEPMHQTTAAFTKCDPSLHRELRTIYYEVRDFQAREGLLQALVHGTVKLNPFTLEQEQRSSRQGGASPSQQPLRSSLRKSSSSSASPQRSSIRATISAARVAPLHELQRAIDAAALMEHKSDTLQQMTLEARIALILREAMLSGRWEPPAVLFSGHMRLTDLYPMLARLGPWARSVGQIPSAESLLASLEQLGTDMVIVDTSSPAYAHQRQLDTINTLVESFDLVAALATSTSGAASATATPVSSPPFPAATTTTTTSLHSIFAVETTTDAPSSAAKLERLSVAEVLAWAERSLLAGRATGDAEVSYSVQDELAEVRATVLERRYRTALVVGASMGPVRGSIDALDFSYVNDALIQRAKLYVDRCAGRSRGVRFASTLVQPATPGARARRGPASPDVSGSMMDVWLQAIEYLIKIRKTALATLKAGLDTVATIKECMSSDDVSAILHRLHLTGFPDGELQIVLSLVNDDTCFSSLLQALQSHGLSISTGGLLNTSAINAEPILQQIIIAESYPARSRRLDRLVEHARCCVDLRKGVLERQWGVPASLREHTDANLRKSLAGTGLNMAALQVGGKMDRVLSKAAAAYADADPGALEVNDVLGHIRPSLYGRMVDAVQQDLGLTDGDQAAGAAADVDDDDDDDGSVSDVSAEEQDWAWSARLVQVPSVRDTLQRFAELEAEAAARPVVGGVVLPAMPECLRDEFRLVEREVERQDLLALFPAAFRAGAAAASVPSTFDFGVTLNTLSVDLCGVSGESLRALVQRVEKWEFASSVANPELRTLKVAGAEMLRIRRELRRLQGDYRRSFQFSARADAPPSSRDAPLATDSPEEAALKLRRHRITQAEVLVGRFDRDEGRLPIGDFKTSSSFLDSAVEQALAKVKHLETPPFAFADEWDPIASLLAEATAAPTVAAAVPEFRLLCAVTVSRTYQQKVLRILYYVNTGDKHIYEDAARAEHLLTELVEANQSLMASLQRLARDHGKLFKPAGSLRYLLESSIFLLHLVRAEICGYRELPNRAWGDARYHNVPSFDALRRHQAQGKPHYTVQALLRAVFRHQGQDAPLDADSAQAPPQAEGKIFESCKLLHPVVESLYLRAMQDVDDDVALHDLTTALQTGGPTVLRQPLMMPSSPSSPSSPAGAALPTFLGVDFSSLASEPLSAALSRVSAAKDGPRDHPGKIAELRLLYQSCVVIADLRAAVIAGDFHSGFGVIDAYLGGDRQDAAVVVKLIHDADYVCHPLARAEFGQLTAHICEGYWRSIEGASMGPGMYVRLFTSLLVLSEQSSVVNALCQESSHIVDAPVQNLRTSDRLPPLDDPFAPVVWGAGGLGSAAPWLREGMRHASSQTDGTAIVMEDSVQEQKYHQLVFERESISHTVEMMRDEKARNLKMLALREAQALARIDQEERRAFFQIDQIVLTDQDNFDRLRHELQEAWCKLELDRSALRELDEAAQRTRSARLAELHDAADRLSAQHLTACREKRKVAEKRMQLDLLLRQVNLQVARR